MRVFLLGAIIGGATVWLWRDKVRERIAQNTRVARERAVETLGVVEGAAEQVLDRATKPFQQAEQVLDQTRHRIRSGLRAGQELIRPHEQQGEPVPGGSEKRTGPGHPPREAGT
jgi:gas vesicle protein